MSAAQVPEPYKPEGRSVNDFDDEEDLRMALMNMNINSRENCSDVREAASEVQQAAKRDGPFPEGAVVDEEEGVELEEEWDWTVTNYDVENSEPQTVAREVQRLQVLKSYQIVGAEREDAFDRICNLGARIFDCCTTFVVLLDMGRQWFASTHGLGDVRETPRKVGFCQHTILYKGDVLVIPDCSKDFRFQNNAYVKNEPHLRFYAGAPLLSPEGFKLGTFCIVDTKPHPSFSENEEANLKDLAAMAMKAMIDRRELKRKVGLDSSQVVASAAHDLLTPLHGMQVSLKTLQEDQAFNIQLGDHQRSCIAATMTSASAMHQICTSTLEMLGGIDAAEGPKKENDKLLGNDHNMEDEAPPAKSIVNVKDCVRRIHTIINPLPKNVPLIIALEQDVPVHIISNDQMILRAALNLLSNACKKTTHGKIQFRVFQRDGHLIFECEDSRTSKGVEDEQSQMDCFNSGCVAKISLEEEMSPLGLSSLASQVNSLGGKFGYRSRGLSSNCVDARGQRKSGVYFWFSVPIEKPDETLLLPQVSQDSVDDAASKTDGEILPAQVQPLEQEHDSSNHMNVFNMNDAMEVQSTQTTTPVTNSERAPIIEKRTKRALVIEDSLVVRNSIARALTKKGYEVFQAADGVEGLQHLQDRIHDVTFCDFMMPNLDGTACVEKYRQWEKENRPVFSQYIIGISAYAKDNNISKGLEAGMNEYRAKPMTTKVITELCQGSEVQELSAFLDRIPFKMNRFVFPEVGKREEPANNHGNPTTTRCLRRRTTRSCDEMELEVTKGSIDAAEGSDTRSRKRMKLNELVAIPQGPDVCLLATGHFSPEMDTLARNMEAMGWKIVGVSERDQVLEVMKLRHWGAVLLFDDMNVSAKGGCVAQFREWEELNRNHRQDNVYLVRACVYPGGSFTPNVPPGFDGEMDRKLIWEHLKGKLGSPKHSSLVHGGGWNVILS